jgi:hypothetical protein
VDLFINLAAIAGTLPRERLGLRSVLELCRHSLVEAISLRDIDLAG